MKRTILILATGFWLLATGYWLPATAQTLSGTAPVKWVSALPATCTTTRRDRVLVYKYTATSGVYYCSAANTWTLVGTNTVSFPLLASDGDASAPTFSFSGDTDTGMYRSGANTLNWTTGGTLRATLSSAGLFTTTGGLASTTGAFTSPVTSTQGTITTSQPFVSHTATWNDAGVTFTNFKTNVTDSASAAGSMLADFQIGGTTKFNVTKAGAGTFAAGVTATTGSFSQGTLTTTAVPWLNHTATWNDGGTTHQGIFSNVTNTASASGSTLLDLQAGGVTQFKVYATAGADLRGDLTLDGTGILYAKQGAWDQGTITTSQPFVSHTATWNNAGVVFENITSDVTDSASNAASTLLDLKVGGTSQFHVDKDGSISSLGNIAGVSGEFTNDVAVADDAYAAGWNGSANVPTKNAVYDEIELRLPKADLLRSYLSSAVTYNNTTTLANTNLSSTVASSGIYRIHIVLFVDSAAVGPKLDFDGGTATVTNFAGAWSAHASMGSWTGGAFVSAITTDTDAVWVGGAPTSLIEFRGTIEVNAGGTFILRAAQTAATASDTTLRRGSSMILTKIS